MIFANWRKWFRVIHRDFGYLFFGATIIYAASGLAINHRGDWNPNYSISRYEASAPPTGLNTPFTKADAEKLLTGAGVESPYQKHYFPTDDQVKVFFESGSLVMDRVTGKQVIESLKRRPLLQTWNRLHYNPGRWWTWFADVFSVALILLAITGLFLLRGHHGITRRGGVLVLIGIILPTILVLYYL